MPEREPKFTSAEIEKKQKEALEMDKKSDEIVEKGEAKTPQEAIDNIEAKELEKSPEEMLYQALPLAWEEALEFAEKNGFATSEEIKKRIDLAKKYNLEIEYFFYSADDINPCVERGLDPGKDYLKRTAEELENVMDVSDELSTQNHRPTYCIFNARCGTIYSYGIDLFSTQFNRQIAQKMEKNGDVATPEKIKLARDKFTNDVKTNPRFKWNKKLALLEVAEEWIKKEEIDCLTISETDFKIPSTPANAEEDANYSKNWPIDKTHLPKHFDITCAKFPLLIVDAGKFGHPGSFLNIMSERNISENHDFYLMKPNLEKKETLTDAERAEMASRGLIYPKHDNPCVLFCPFDDEAYLYSEATPWWDNVPVVLGTMGKRFEHQSKLYPSEKIVKEAIRVEYASNKIRDNLRYYQKDGDGKNWFERNFEGIMLGKKDAPEKGNRGYLERFRKWVPYETNEKGEAILDDKGYPVPRAEAPMTIAAQDELARLEAAMEELEK